MAHTRLRVFLSLSLLFSGPERFVFVFMSHREKTKRKKKKTKTHPSFADDEKGVTSRSLPDDVVALIVEGLIKQKSETHDIIHQSYRSGFSGKPIDARARAHGLAVGR